MTSVFQRSLLAAGPPWIDPRARADRIDLGHASWVDVRRDWLRGSDDLLDQLVDAVAWRRGRRHMYDRMVDDPRLSRWFPAREALPHPVLGDLGAAIAQQYGVEFGAVGLNYYRDGRDSVAFHADRELRVLDDTLIAIVTLGARRPFLLRAKVGGRSLDLAPGGGDLLVMGGACQRHFEHCVPKLAHAGPRISASWRWSRPAPVGAA